MSAYKGYPGRSPQPVLQPQLASPVPQGPSPPNSGVQVGTNPLNRQGGGYMGSPRIASPVQASPPGSQFGGVGPTATFPMLNGLSFAELQGVLQDESSYDALLASLPQMQQINEVRDSLRKSNLELARRNMAKESEIAELRTQCRIIRGTELGEATERLHEKERKMREVNAKFSPAILLLRLEEAANSVDDDSEKLHQQFLNREKQPHEFIQKYKELRILYHRRAQLKLAAQLSLSHLSS
eukprot:TRINITY_DN13290_c0_g1_i1.p1 TRINITY_DN13290_c0_g1~~TRINITY_DN13290_c0_g1_i1.p1  ORF type:complete len:240 (+),score=43.29 TRINITY_DN13290_c0_g1_i1:149-868(+)